MNFLDILWRGGILMIPIVICSLIALAIFVERLLALRRVRINARMFLLQIKSMIRPGNNREAIQLCQRTPGPIAKIMRAGLERMHRPRQEIKDAIESAGRTEIHLLEKYLGILATIASVAPMLGFLGTVTGMIRAFMEIQTHGGNVDAAVLAGGIWEALITTAAGLSVGIPAQVFYNWIQSQVERAVFEMEESSTAILDLVHGGENSLVGEAEAMQ